MLNTLTSKDIVGTNLPVNPPHKQHPPQQKITKKVHWKDTTCIAKADTGATCHYWKVGDKNCLLDVHKEQGPNIVLPNASVVTSSEVGYLPISEDISKEGKKVRIVPQLQSSSLISVGQLADDGCKVQLDSNKITVTKKGKNILIGHINVKDGLYDVLIKRKQQIAYNVNTISNSSLHMLVNEQNMKDNKIHKERPEEKKYPDKAPNKMQNRTQLKEMLRIYTDRNKHPADYKKETSKR